MKLSPVTLSQETRFSDSLFLRYGIRTKTPGQKPPGHKPPDKNPLDKNPPCQKPPGQKPPRENL